MARCCSASYFVVKAWSYGLDRYLLLYSDNGVVVGAGYTDLHVELPVLWACSIALAVACAVARGSTSGCGPTALPLAASCWCSAARSCSTESLPALFQRFYVKPSELQLETPYIERNIALTREAYNLRQIAVKPFPVETGLSSPSLEANRATIDNIRLWDCQPLMDTYAQLQEIRTYYKFLDVDVDRYWLDGSYQQVMLSARELEPTLLPPNAQTWVNRHVLFTHGNGVVSSPVTQKSRGRPAALLPQGHSAGRHRRARASASRASISARAARHYVIVKGSTPEFDYPKGKDNVYTSYDGADGVADRRPGLAQPVLLVFQRPQHPAQRLHHRREPDPVPSQHPGAGADDRSLPQPGPRSLLVISEGGCSGCRTPTPQATGSPTPSRNPRGGLNYIRNSVKIVIDAYNGRWISTWRIPGIR